MMGWMQIGSYEYEHNGLEFTGWYRCVGGRLVSGHWPQWNNLTGATR